MFNFMYVLFNKIKKVLRYLNYLLFFQHLQKKYFYYMHHQTKQQNKKHIISLKNKPLINLI